MSTSNEMSETTPSRPQWSQYRERIEEFASKNRFTYNLLTNQLSEEMAQQNGLPLLDWKKQQDMARIWLLSFVCPDMQYSDRAAKALQAHIKALRKRTDVHGQSKLEDLSSDEDDKKAADLASKVTKRKRTAEQNKQSNDRQRAKCLQKHRIEMNDKQRYYIGIEILPESHSARRAVLSVYGVCNAAQRKRWSRLNGSNVNKSVGTTSKGEVSIPTNNACIFREGEDFRVCDELKDSDVLYRYCVEASVAVDWACRSSNGEVSDWESELRSILRNAQSTVQDDALDGIRSVTSLDHLSTDVSQNTVYPSQMADVHSMWNEGPYKLTVSQSDVEARRPMMTPCTILTRHAWQEEKRLSFLITGINHPIMAQHRFVCKKACLLLLPKGAALPISFASVILCSSLLIVHGMVGVYTWPSCPLNEDRLQTNPFQFQMHCSGKTDGAMKGIQFLNLGAGSLFVMEPKTIYALVASEKSLVWQIPCYYRETDRHPNSETVRRDLETYTRINARLQERCPGVRGNDLLRLDFDTWQSVFSSAKGVDFGATNRYFTAHSSHAGESSGKKEASDQLDGQFRPQFDSAMQEDACTSRSEGERYANDKVQVENDEDDDVTIRGDSPYRSDG